ncbi:hypothetical protein P872_19210 [Rhodonellum psychrophilum GCM71 = DSM 17998]|uniref:CBU-0592-like domain-containing protein n=2 Tax=Rhodonellum TaxID=336827 RepID=U5BMP3_9BACT|nr:MULTISPECIES: hypothetical protein [Rhodonellum]ERM81785.1 hypothetical protein P872_19210 [Rhodonellum psychrophilum GCM71 = DSM 17998]SDZ47802.1 hypothetical protein SAMN05444412_11677 [Rhodonellum ikkaensis]
MSDLKFWMDGLGWLGAVCFLASYYLLITKKWKSSSFKYHLANLLGALFLVVNTLYDTSFPSVFINLCWAAMAVLGMVVDRKSGLEKNN